MERIKKYKKEIIGVTLIVSIVAGSLLLIEPSKLGSEKAAYKDIDSKKSFLIDVNNQSTEYVNKNKTLQEELSTLEKETSRVKSLAEIKRAEINDEDLEYHLPSILIRLENNAIKNNLKLDIDHSGIKVYDVNTSNALEDNIDILEEDVEDDIEEDEDISDEITKEAEEPEAEEILNSKIEGDNKDSKLHNSINVPMIYGFNTTIIPLTVEGQFRDVRNFINYLDKINYIDNTSISLSSNGEKVTGKILISVFHGSL